ncbi:hypothetical protein I4U23_027486 [Adineta vaga]|nr:hypothetical protein I4U23_027486 [Adineta vaga]
MTYYCLLDRLPVELLRNLFTYFLTHELFFSFSDISDYVDNVLLSFISNQPNFQSIRKDYFDLICHYIQPEQVTSLTLSDDDDTPDQSKLFLKHFQIEQFTQLRSLRLISIELDSLSSIVPKLHKLNQFHSLSFNVESIKYKHLTDIHRINNLLDYINTKIIPKLEYVYLTNDISITTQPLPYLHHLKFNHCSLEKLAAIFQNALQLKSLNICLNVFQKKFQIQLPVNQLIRLNMKINRLCVSMDETEDFLVQFPNLKYLSLQMCGQNDLADGDRWKQLTKFLMSFKFFFTIDLCCSSMIESLNTFRSSFWLEEKHWFVAYQRGCMFSIPQIAPIHNDIPYRLPIHSTSSNITSIFNHINHIFVDAIPANNSIYFAYIKILVLRCSISVDILSSIIDLNQIEHLIIWSIDDLLKFIPLNSIMSRLNKLTIAHNIRIHTIKLIGTYQFKQIRYLKINLENENFDDEMITELTQIFPDIEYLKIYMTFFLSHMLIGQVIDDFKHLSNISLFYSSTVEIINPSSYYDMNLIIQNSRKLKENHFTHRVCKATGQANSFNIHLWIGRQTSFIV